MLNGISLVACGFGREWVLRKEDFFEQITSFDCMFKMPWPILMLLAGIFPASANFIISLERFFAVYFCNSYRSWKNHKQFMLFGATVYSLLIFSIAMSTVFFFPITNPDKMCVVTNSVGIVYATFHYTICSFTYFVSFIVVVYVWIAVRKHRTMGKHEQRMQHTSVGITLTSVIFTVIPNCVVLMDAWHQPKMSELIVGIAYCFYGLQSCLCLVVFIAFRPEFNARLKALIFCGIHRTHAHHNSWSRASNARLVRPRDHQQQIVAKAEENLNL
ncbi:unnamed protein product, partial [Mesorhabditis belari]|uniref:G-protein coupled receptors family 1 profile domain-containing protein n=1 Tax=Mesorhabditis belari TaxID=2138241 RepID=A0AAF3EUB8_9BILA